MKTNKMDNFDLKPQDVIDEIRIEFGVDAMD